MQKRSKLLNKLFKYGVAALVLAVPLFPKFPLFNVPGTHVAIRLEDLLIVVVVGFWFMVDTPNPKFLIRDKISGPIILFVAVGFISLLSAIFVTKSVVVHIGLLHWARRVQYLLPLYFGMSVLKNKEVKINYFLNLLVIIILIAFFYGVGQRYLNWPVIITQNLEYSKGIALRWVPGSHINSTFAGHYDLATFLVMGLPIIVSLFLVSKKTSKYILGATFVAGLWLLGSAVSRISIASYLIGVSFALNFIKKTRAIIPVVLFSVVFFGMSSSLLTRYWRIIDALKDNLMGGNVTQVYAQDIPQRTQVQTTPTPTPIPIIEDRSTSIRLNVEWPRAIRAFSKNPLLGTGYSSITLATDNDYLRLLGEVGVLGLVAFILIFVRAGILLAQKMPLAVHFKGPKLAFLGGFFGSLPGILLNAVFIDIFEASKFALVFWLFMGFPLYLLRNTAKK